MEAKVLKVLSALEAIEDKATRFWNIPPATGSFLNMLVRITKAKKILEIGTSNGYSGIYLADALSDTQGCLYTIESHKERFEMATQNFKKAGLSQYIKQIFGHAPEILASLDNDFDLVFLDATKVEYKSYLEALLPRIKPGGVIVADNCLSHRSELGDFFTLVEKTPELQTMLLPFDNGLMLGFKSGVKIGP